MSIATLTTAHKTLARMPTMMDTGGRDDDEPR